MHSESQTDSDVEKEVTKSVHHAKDKASFSIDSFVQSDFIFFLMLFEVFLNLSLKIDT